MAALGVTVPLADGAVRAAVRAVLAGERAAPAVVSVTFLSTQRMRVRNRRSLGRDRATDVIAFGMDHGDTRVADVYVCPAVAATSAARYGVSLRDELLRLIVHGVLHALGHDHPDGTQRMHSGMWRLQERYLRAIRRRRGR